MRIWRNLCMAILGVLICVPAAHSINVYSDGSDGALELLGSGETTIDLSLAVTGFWDDPGSGNGVYDPDKWAVVFKYSSVTIDAGHTMTFANHPSGAPVIWLVQGDATIAGTVKLDGEVGQSAGNFAEPGPGGFRGGRGYLSAQSPGSAGFGPGGGEYYLGGNVGYGGGYGTAGGGAGGGPVYGNARILPLIGGSGASGDADHNAGGGAGGGAILIAAAGILDIGGGIHTRGGAYTGAHAGGGSGGGIRLIADEILGVTSGLLAMGGSGYAGGGCGRIRLECNTLDVEGASNPNYTLLIPLEGDDAVVWPPEGSPEVRVMTFAGLPVPADPESEFNPPGDLLVISEDVVDIELETTNVPLDWTVEVRIAPRSGDEYILPATFVSGDEVSAIYEATTPAPLPAAEFVVVQARAYQPAGQ